MPSIRNSKLVLINAPTRNNEKSRGFYSALLGAEFAHGLSPSVASWWTPLDQGIDFTITDRYDDRERLTPYFAVDNLDAAIQALEAVGGRTVVVPRSIPLGPDKASSFYVKQKKKDGQPISDEESKTVGRMAVMLDPDLNHVGLMELAPHAQSHFMWSKSRKKLKPQEVAAFSEVKKLADELEANGALPKA